MAFAEASSVRSLASSFKIHDANQAFFTMDRDPQTSIKHRITTLSSALMDRLSKFSLAENFQVQKYYDKILNTFLAYKEIVLDEKGTVLTWNSNFEKLEGYKEDEIIGQSFNLFYLPSDRQHKIPEQLLRAAATSGKCRYFGQFVKKDGGTFWGNIVLTAVRNNQEILGFILICRTVVKK
jgi:PAS domain S-box-containing protein